MRYVMKPLRWQREVPVLRAAGGDWREGATLGYTVHRGMSASYAVAREWAAAHGREPHEAPLYVDRCVVVAGEFYAVKTWKEL